MRANSPGQVGREEREQRPPPSGSGPQSAPLAGSVDTGCTVTGSQCAPHCPAVWIGFTLTYCILRVSADVSFNLVNLCLSVVYQLTTIVYSLQTIVYSLQSIVYSLQTIVYSLQYIDYSLQTSLKLSISSFIGKTLFPHLTSICLFIISSVTL